MHLAQFVHRYPPALGGAEAYTARLCDYLAQLGDRVRVWTSSAIQLADMWRTADSSEDSSGQQSDEGSEPLVCRYRPLGFPGRRYILKALSLVPSRRWQCLTSPCNPVSAAMWNDAGAFSGPVDAVHATAFPYSFPIVCGLRLARLRAVPFFLTPFLHLGDIADPNDPTRRQYTRPHLRWLLHQADGIFVQTAREREAVIHLGVPEHRVFLQGLGVDPMECTRGDRQSLRGKWRMGPRETVIGHLANASLEKGTCDLLRAAESLWDLGLEFKVVLAGPEMPNFVNFWKTYPAKRNVIRLGMLTDAEKRDFFAAIDAFALPSRTDSFGLVLLEAWANGKPNLVYRAGGPAELVRNGSDGLQAACGNIVELGQQLRLLIERPELRHELGNNGLARIHREFLWEDKLELVRSIVFGATQINKELRSRRESRVHVSLQRAGQRTLG